MSVGLDWEGISSLQGDWSEEALEHLQAADAWLTGWDDELDCLPDSRDACAFSGGGSRMSFSDRLYASFLGDYGIKPPQEREGCDPEIHKALLEEMAAKGLSICVKASESNDCGMDVEQWIFTITSDGTAFQVSVETPEQLWNVSLEGDWSEQALANVNALGKWLSAPEICADCFGETSNIAEKWAFSSEQRAIRVQAEAFDMVDALEWIRELEGFDTTVYQALAAEMLAGNLTIVFWPTCVDEDFDSACCPPQTLVSDGTDLQQEYRYEDGEDYDD